MTADPAISIVVAVKDAEGNLPAIIESLSGAIAAGAEVIFVSAGPAPPVLAGEPRTWRTLEAGADALIPHLWRDGVRAARAPGVALTTAHCLPTHSWAARLLDADLDAHAGVGGVIDMDPACDPRRQAIYFLRYLAFAPPQPAREVREIAADNAIYRRSEILRHADLLADGFWEPSFHARFRRDGLTLNLDPALEVAYKGLERGGDFAAQRYAHGREYGASRATGRPFARRLGLLAASPLVPLVLLARIVRRTRGQARFRDGLPRALPWLAVFTLAWSLGEARGYLDALAGTPRTSTAESGI